jgi:hypothetical protein
MLSDPFGVKTGNRTRFLDIPLVAVEVFRMALVLRPPSERESLPGQLADLGRSRKRVALAAGLFAFVATAVGLATLTGFLDAAIHLAPIYRALALVVILVAAGVVWLRGVARAVRYRTDALSVALELEDQFPSLNDSLASAIEFLEPGEEGADEEDELPRARPGVSNRLTASAVKVAERKAGRLPLDRIVPTGHCWRAAWTCVAVLAVALPLSLWNTARASTALVRLADPFGAHSWPTKTRIELLAPEFPARVSKGEPFELKFAVRGVLTGPATVRVRVEGGGEFEEQFPLAINNDPKYAGAAVVTARFDPSRVSSSFEVRVTANDADTDWRAVTVVPPPRLVPLDGRPSPQFHATPPTYTGLGPVQLPDGAAVIEVPTGTLLRFRAATDVKLSAATLVYAGDRSAVLNAAPVAFLGHTNPFSAIGCQGLADQLGADIPLTLSGDGMRLAAEFVPPLSGPYALRLTDDTGLTGTRLVEIRLTADPVPVVTLARPLAGFDPPVLMPTASVVVATSAEDKLYGVRRSFLEYRIGRDGPLQVMPLTQAPKISGPALAALAGGPAFGVVPPSGVVDVLRVIPVAEFRRPDGTSVHEGDLLVIRAAADDWDDVAALKGPGRSVAEVEIRIASPETIEAWLQKELASIRPELIRVRDQQRDAKQKVGEVIPLPGGAVSPADRDKLIAAEQIQRQVRGKIGDARDGMRAKADLLRATVQANRLPRSNMTDRVEIVATELGRTADRDLGTIEQNIAEARQLSSQPKPGQEEQLADFLRKTGRHQKNVEDTATALLDLLSQWGGPGEIRGEARVLKDSILRQIAANEHLKVPEGKLKPSEDEQRELDRAAVRAEQSAEQAGQLIARAARLASEKDKQAADLRAQAELKDKQATELRLQAAETQNPVDKSALSAKADAAAATAADLRAAADKAAAEAAALRKGLDAAGGQGLPDDLRKAAELLRRNRQSDAAALERSAVSRLDALAGALTENEPDAVPELSKPKNLKGAADQLDKLAAAQEELRKRAEAAARIMDPEKRQAALKELAKEQDQLIERGREILQKLVREKSDAAADARAALDKMEAARDDLEQGRPSGRAQAEAVDKLDNARDKLDVAAAQAGRQLSDEKRRKLADQVKALLERQRAAVAEVARIHGEVAKAKSWDRLLRTSYSDLESVREKEIAIEVRKLAEGEFAALPVFARLLTDSANAIDGACKRIQNRLKPSDDDPASGDIDNNDPFDAELNALNDRKVERPMKLALKRLEQLAEALKPDDPKKQPTKKDGGPPPKAPQNPPPNPNGGGEQDVVPPLAQLKVLRALQAELNERTTQFAKDHPDPDKLTDEEKAELKELEQTQREITELFEKMAKLFEKKEKEMPAPGPEKQP